MENEVVHNLGGGTGTITIRGIVSTYRPYSIEQAPPSPIAPTAPKSSMTALPIGTKVTSSYYCPGAKTQIATDAITGKPIYETPVSATLTGDRVSTISKQSGDRPGPTPPVGTVSPQAGEPVSCFSAAPKKSMWGGLVLFAGVLIGIWIFAGAALRRLV